MEITDILAMLDGIEGADDARSALTEYGTVAEGMNAKIKELEDALAEAQAKYTETAARNYELLQGATGKVEQTEEEAAEGDDPDSIIDTMIKED